MKTMYSEQSSLVKKPSRALELDIEKCSAVSGLGRFEIVLMAAHRAREIKKQNYNQPNQMNNSMTALLEIQSGEVGPEYLRKLGKAL